MATLKLFKACLPSVNYVFRNGKPGIFVNGRYATSIPEEIEELTAEINAGHPHLFIDAEESEIDSEKVDPIQALRASIEKEIRAQMAAATNPENDMGESAQGPVVPTNTNNIAQAATGGSGVALAARLVNLK
jgi:hypothetical protein